MIVEMRHFPNHLLIAILSTEAVRKKYAFYYSATQLEVISRAMRGL